MDFAQKNLAPSISINKTPLLPLSFFSENCSDEKCFFRFLIPDTGFAASPWCSESSGSTKMSNTVGFIKKHKIKESSMEKVGVFVLTFKVNNTPIYKA